MLTRPSSMRPAWAVVLIVFWFLLGPSLAHSQETELSFDEPFLAHQVAFANGFIAAVEYLNGQMQAGRLDAARLARLANPEGRRLRELVLERAREYQQTLIRYNQGQIKIPAAE